MSDSYEILQVPRDLLATLSLSWQMGLDFHEEMNQLRALLAAPAVERQPDAWGDLDVDTCDEDRMLITDKDAAEVYDRQCYKLTPLFTSPPASVAVPDDIAQNAKRYEWIRSPNVGHCEISRVLFETISDDCNPPYRALKCGKDLDDAVDACLDKVKEMNR